MYAGRVACCLLLIYGQYAHDTDRWTDGRTPGRYITLSTRRCQRNNSTISNNMKLVHMVTNGWVLTFGKSEEGNRQCVHLPKPHVKCNNPETTHQGQLRRFITIRPGICELTKGLTGRVFQEKTSGLSVECMHAPRHIEIGTVSLPVSRTCVRANEVGRY